MKAVWGETTPAGIALRLGFCPDWTPCLPTQGNAGGRELRTTFPMMQPGGGRGRARRPEPGLCWERQARAVFLGPGPDQGRWEGEVVLYVAMSVSAGCRDPANQLLQSRPGQTPVPSWGSGRGQ